MSEELKSSPTERQGWSVVVVYEDAECREAAVTFCDRLVERFWNQCEFGIDWWSFDQLREPNSAEQAAGKTVEANFMVFATRPQGVMPRELVSWVESWAHRRGDREGALVGLLDPSTDPEGCSELKHMYLRGLAHRLDADYLTQLPLDLRRAAPESLDSYTERADQMTSVLDEILRQPRTPERLLAPKETL